MMESKPQSFFPALVIRLQMMQVFTSESWTTKANLMIVYTVYILSHFSDFQ